MQIIQTIVVKQVLTEKSKEVLYEKFENNKQNLLKENEQLKFELRKYEKSNKYNSTSLKTNFAKELNKRQEKIKLLDFQMEQLHKLPVGSELKESEVQAIIEVQPGDNWNEIVGKKTILIKDGIVQDIR